MSKVRLELAREMIRDKRYNDAREILIQLPGNPIAIRWLERLDELLAPERDDSSTNNGDMFVDMATFGIVVAFVVFLMLFLFSRWLLGEIPNFMPTYYPSPLPYQPDRLNFLMVLPLFLIVGLFAGIIGALLLAVQNVSIHYVATRLFSADGTLANLSQQMIWLYLFSYIFYAVIFTVLVGAIYIHPLLSGLISMLLMISLIVFVWLFSSHIARAYQLNIFQGFLALFFGWISTSFTVTVMYIGCYIVFISMMLSSIMSSAQHAF